LYSQVSDSNNETTGNVGVGFTASYYNITGQNNTAVGYSAMIGVSGNSHSNNTAIGFEALKSITTGHSNVAIGAGAGDALVNGVSNVIIGKDAEANSTDGGNCIVIGAGAVGQDNNSVTLGNADVTDVYMGSDSGATVHCAGIKFDASGEVLGDYEEGEHPTAITGATSGSWVLDSAQNKLSYTKIGRMVTVQGKFETDSGSGAGSLKISLPFAAADLSVGSAISVGSITINRYGSTSIPRQITPIIFEGNDFVNVQIHSTDGTSNESYLQANDIDAIFEGQLTITYIAA